MLNTRCPNSLATVIVMFITAVASGVVFAESRPPPLTDDMSLSQKIEATRAHLGAPGVVVAVYRDGEALIDNAFGVASRETGEAMTTGHHFRVASIAKPVIATILLQLVDEGKVSLDDPIDRYVKNVPAGDRITLRMLAQHTSGLRNYVAIPDVRKAFGEDVRREWSVEELLGLAYDFGPHFKPEDDGWMYSNTNYLLLGEVIERIDGKPLAESVSLRVCEPLGLTATRYTTDPSMPSPATRGYQMGDDKGPRFWVGEGETHWDVTDASPTMWHAAGAMVSTLDDVRRLTEAVASGELLSGSSHAEQMTWRNTFYPVDYRYGLGVVNYMGTIGHSGFVPGFQVTASHEPEMGVTVVVLANLYSSHNYEDPANAIFFVIMRHLTGKSYAPPGWEGW